MGVRCLHQVLFKWCDALGSSVRHGLWVDGDSCVSSF